MARRGRQQIEVIMGRLEGLTERAVKKITLDATANLIEATPVDTGWARANWVPAIGLPEQTPAKASPEQSDVPGQRAKQSAGQAAVATGYSLGRGSVFISNNVPYIVGLNEGTSAQAPSGFVQAAIRKAVTQDIRGL